MVNPIDPATFPYPSPSLSDGAKIILRYFRDKNIPQLAYEYPAILAALFADQEECERAQHELYQLGFIELDPAPHTHIPVKSRVRSAAITLEGERYIEKNQI